MSTDQQPLPRLGRRQVVPELQERLQVLLASGRNPRIPTGKALDRELGLDDSGGSRQWYRSGRTNGIPYDVLERFLDLFRLRLDELLSPLPDFKRLVQQAPAPSRAPIDWRGAETHTATFQANVRPPGDLSFSWPALGMKVDLVSESTQAAISGDESALQLLNLRRRESVRPRVRLQRNFRFELALPFQATPGLQLLGLVEGSELHCFHPPQKLFDPSRPIRVPSGGEPFYFDDLGLHTLWVILFSGTRVNAHDIVELQDDDARLRGEAAARIYLAARHDAPDSVIVLRADFEVVA